VCGTPNVQATATIAVVEDTNKKFASTIALVEKNDIDAFVDVKDLLFDRRNYKHHIIRYRKKTHKIIYLSIIYTE
jgi:hypothetical protein